MTEATTETQQDTVEQPQEGGGEQAKTFDAEYVDKLRKEAAKYRTEAKANAEAAKRLAAIEDAQKTEAERAQQALLQAQEQVQTWQKTAVGHRIEALAGEFADPSDAVGQLDPGKYLDVAGQIDDAAIQADLAELLEKKPHWRRAAGSGVRLPAPNAAQGTGGSPNPDPRATFAQIFQQARK